MSITFRECAAEVELGLVSTDHLPEIATSGLLEGYESAALSALAAQFGEPCDTLVAERLWAAALQELEIPQAGCTEAARLLVRGYARLVAEGELPPQLGASKIAGVHRLACRTGCDRSAPGACLGAERVIALFYAADGRGYCHHHEHHRLDVEIISECRLLAGMPVAAV